MAGPTCYRCGTAERIGPLVKIVQLRHGANAYLSLSCCLGGECERAALALLNRWADGLRKMGEEAEGSQGKLL